MSLSHWSHDGSVKGSSCWDSRTVTSWLSRITSNIPILSTQMKWCGAHSSQFNGSSLTRWTVAKGLLRKQAHLQCAFEKHDQQEENRARVGAVQTQRFTHVLRHAASGTRHPLHRLQAHAVRACGADDASALRSKRMRRRVAGTNLPASISFPYLLRTIYDRPVSQVLCEVSFVPHYGSCQALRAVTWIDFEANHRRFTV